MTSEGNRALARGDINPQINNQPNNEPPRKANSETSHELKIVIERNKYTAKCFDCDFEVETNTGCSLILFDAEDQGRITPLDCPHEHEAKVFSWIIAIRNGWVTVSYLKTNHTI